jgi:hypothetical protein
MNRLVLLISLILTSCTFRAAQPTPSPTEPARVVLGLSISNLDNPFLLR